MQVKGLGQIRWVRRFRQARCAAQLVCAFLLVLALIGPAAAAKKRSTPKKKPLPAQKHPSFSTDAQNEMCKYLGVRYRPGGSSTNGVDCSGFVGLVYRNLYGVTDLPHQSASLYRSSALERIALERLNTGDLLYFASSRKSKRINHVGIFLSDRNFIHAARGKGVIISSLDDPYWRARIVGANRLPGLDRRYKGLRQEPALEAASRFEFQGFDISTLSWDLPSTSTFDVEPQEPPIMGHAVGLELGFGDPLAGDATGLLNLTLFQAPLLAWRGAEFYPPFSSPLEDYSRSGERPSSAGVLGIALGSDIRPFEWLRFSPSLTYFKYDSGIDDSGLPRRSIGLDMALGSAEEGWVLSTGFRYSSLIPARNTSSLIPSRTYSDDSDLQNALGWSLTLMQRLSNSLSISLIGERSQRIGVASSDLSREEKSWDERKFSLMFNFSY
ncbi:MAG: NlpC/P60 family protein [Thermodesulfobacteriota bacterium]